MAQDDRWSLFGFTIQEKDKPREIASFTNLETDDGALVVSAGGTYGTYLDLEGSAKTDAELVAKYREMALQPECETAIDEIINEGIVKEGNEKVIELNLDDLNLGERLKTAIKNEFDNVVQLLDFNNSGYEIFRRWYIDGRLYYHVMIDDANPREGIQELRYVDPRKIRKVRSVKREKRGMTYVNITSSEFYMYNERGFKGASATGMDNQGLKISPDSIIYTTSGLLDKDGKMVLSYMHKAIKALNQLRILEDATVIYRISRAPERRIFYVDVGNLPKMKAEQYVRDQMVKHRNRLIYDADSGSLRDDRKFMCYALDTKIPLLDGRTLTLQEIIKEYNENPTSNWVYSCNPKTGEFMPGPISWAGITKHNTQVVRVALDNGKSVICTPDHKFPVWNKGLVEAKDLAKGESLIPGYRRHVEIMPGGRKYEQIYKNDTGTWEFTHREVAAWKDRLGIREDFVFADKYSDSSKYTIHHKDFNGDNNSPNNLVMMNYMDHMKYHQSIQSIEYTPEIFTIVESCAKTMLKSKDAIGIINKSIDFTVWRNLNSNKNPKNRDVNTLIFTHKDLTRICKHRGYTGWRAYRSQYDTSIRETNGRVKRGIVDKYSQEWKNKLSQAAKQRKTLYCKTWKIIDPNGQTEIVENLNAYCREMNLNRSNIKGVSGSKGYHAEQLHNHKVVSVEWLDEKIDVGALTIDQNETYHSNHTYLLDAGVYTKNTMLEDYWLPRREGSRGTEISTLPAAQNLGEMADVEYFQKKLYKALNVPYSRNEEGGGFNLGRSSEISRDELKFQKFINRLRLRFSRFLLEALKKQLILKGIMNTKEFESIENMIHFTYAKDSYFAELKEQEVWTSRMDLLEKVDPFVGKYVSIEWVAKKVLHQTDDDIKDIATQNKRDKKILDQFILMQQGMTISQAQDKEIQSPDFILHPPGSEPEAPEAEPFENVGTPEEEEAPPKFGPVGEMPPDPKTATGGGKKKVGVPQKKSKNLY